MARPLTAKERTMASLMWPNMTVSGVVVTDEATPVYNCLAWTLGITTTWLWPWPPGDVTKGEFDTLYGSYGFAPSATGPIAVFGTSPASMKHGSVSGPD